MEEDVIVMSVTDSVEGTISSTYLDYFAGIVEKLPIDQHYVIWKSGDYEYTLAYGADLQLSGSTFSGSGVELVQIYRETSDYSSSWLVRSLSDDIEVSAGNLFIYSDLGMYSTVERGLSSYEGMALLFAVVFATLLSVFNNLFSFLLQRRCRS